MSQTSECKKCHKHFKMLVDGTCFFCNQQKWNAYFKKLEGKGERK